MQVYYGQKDFQDPNIKYKKVYCMKMSFILSNTNYIYNG